MTTNESLRGRVCLLTGASGGIGGALVARLAQEGLHVALAYGSHQAEAERAAGTVRAHGGRAVMIPGDLADAGVPRRLVERATEELGPVEVLVANAGRAQRSSYDELEVADWDATLDVNLRAPFLLAQAVLPGMRHRQFGRVLFV
ncbi:MAG: SDR family NAD(P)-dependent oxidoreductase, partial [Acidimicrobiales bacterium]|nr:SDR family NAD(P)-dependent oxidoreductase [Acidimicrobiales bacterium]